MIRVPCNSSIPMSGQMAAGDRQAFRRIVNGSVLKGISRAEDAWGICDSNELGKMKEGCRFYF
jgi:hypothetical protein